MILQQSFASGGRESFSVLYIGKCSLPIITKENWSRHEYSASETRPNCVRVIYGRYISYQNGGGELSKMRFVLINCDSNI